MEQNESSMFMLRHTIKPKGEDLKSERYPGASERGVDLAKERTKEEILSMIEKAKPGTVVIITGASEVDRTKSAGEIYGDELQELLKDNPGYLVITRSEIQDMRSQKEGGNALNKLTEIVKSNPDKKIIIDFPLFLREFAFGAGRWTEKSGDPTEYFQALLKKHNNDEMACVKDWIENEGRIDKLSLQGPNPAETAKEHVAGLKRINDFARKLIGESRPIMVGGVGHSVNLDATAIYLSNNGQVTMEGFEKLGGELIKETELMQLETKDGKTIFNYRGKEFIV
ncbi:MAG: hypothetical protein WAV73_03700 [Candidatus Moraniibacteriota bacterium]